MSKFRKKPLIIEATQWFSGKDVPGVALCDRQKPDGTRDIGAFVTTIHGQITWVAEGDWVIAEPDGIHYYPCKPDIFEKTYEPVNE